MRATLSLWAALYEMAHASLPGPTRTRFARPRPLRGPIRWYAGCSIFPSMRITPSRRRRGEGKGRRPERPLNNTGRNMHPLLASLRVCANCPARRLLRYNLFSHRYCDPEKPNAIKIRLALVVAHADQRIAALEGAWPGAVVERLDHRRQRL